MLKAFRKFYDDFKTKKRVFIKINKFEKSWEQNKNRFENFSIILRWRLKKRVYMKINKKNDLSQCIDFDCDNEICNHCKFRLNEHIYDVLNMLYKKNQRKLWFWLIWKRFVNETFEKIYFDSQKKSSKQLSLTINK